MKTSILEMRVLEPEIEENWLTDGTSFSKEVYLGKEASPDDWHEVTSADYQNYLKQQEASQNV